MSIWRPVDFESLGSSKLQEEEEVICIDADDSTTCDSSTGSDSK